MSKKSIGQMGDLWSWTSVTESVSSAYTDYAVAPDLQSKTIVVPQTVEYTGGRIYLSRNINAVYSSATTCYLTLSTTEQGANNLVYVNGTTAVAITSGGVLNQRQTF